MQKYREREYVIDSSSGCATARRSRRGVRVRRRVAATANDERRRVPPRLTLDLSILRRRQDREREREGTGLREGVN